MEISRANAIKDIYGVEEVSEQQCKNFLAILGDLSDREERILRLYYGLDDNKQRSLQDLANEFGVTRERIRQVISSAIKKLRHPTRSNSVIGK